MDLDDAVNPSGTIAKSDAMFVGAYLKLLNLGAGVQRRQGDAEFSVRTDVGFLCQPIGRNIRLHGSGGPCGTAGYFASRTRLNPLC